jgi:hypothetical protein
MSETNPASNVISGENAPRKAPIILSESTNPPDEEPRNEPRPEEIVAENDGKK